MNNQRRTEIREIINSLKTLYSSLTKVLDNINSVKDDESYAYDSLPENLQASQKAEDMESAIDALDDAYNNISDALASIEESKSSLLDATA